MGLLVIACRMLGRISTAAASSLQGWAVKDYVCPSSWSSSSPSSLSSIIVLIILIIIILVIVIIIIFWIGIIVIIANVAANTAHVGKSIKT